MSSRRLNREILKNAQKVSVVFPEYAFRLTSFLERVIPMCEKAVIPGGARLILRETGERLHRNLLVDYSNGILVRRDGVPYEDRYMRYQKVLRIAYLKTVAGDVIDVLYCHDFYWKENKTRYRNALDREKTRVNIGVTGQGPSPAV